MKRGRIEFIEFIRKNVLYILIGILGSAVISMMSLYMIFRTGAYILPCLFCAALSVLFSYAVASKRNVRAGVLMHSALLSGSMLSATLAAVMPEVIVEKTVLVTKVPSYYLSESIYGFGDYFAKKKQFADSFLGESESKVEGVSLGELFLPLVAMLAAVLVLTLCFTWIKRDAYVRRKECDFPEGLAASMIITGTGQKQTVTQKTVFGAFAGAGVTAIREIALRLVGEGKAGNFAVSPLLCGLGYIAGFKRSVMMLAGAVFSYLCAIVFTKETPAEFARFEMGVGLMIGAGIGTMLDMFIARLEAKERRRLDGYTAVQKSSLGSVLARNAVPSVLCVLVYLLLCAAGIPAIYGILLVCFGYVACHAGASVKGESGVMTVSVPVAVGTLAVMTLDALFGLDVRQMFLSVLFVAAATAVSGSLTDSYKVGMRLGIKPRGQLAMHIVGLCVGAAAALISFFVLIGSGVQPTHNAVSVRELFANGIQLRTVWLPAAVSAALVLLKLPAASFAVGAFLTPFYSLSFFAGGLVRFINVRRKRKTDFNIAMGLGAGESVALCIIALISWIIGV